MGSVAHDFIDAASRWFANEVFYWRDLGLEVDSSRTPAIR